MKKILLVEDDEEIVKVLQYILEKTFQVEVATCKQQALHKINQGEDLAILDICLPDGNSFDFSQQIKCPIIYLTAKDDEESIVQGLTLGEEYMIKPFKAKELLLRIDKVLQRVVTTNIHYKDIIIDTNSYKVYVQNKEIGITTLDYKMIELLFSNIGKVITRNQISDLIYDNTRNFVEDNTMNVYVKRVRDKLQRDYIKTVKRVGYIVEKN